MSRVSAPGSLIFVAVHRMSASRLARHVRRLVHPNLGRLAGGQQVERVVDHAVVTDLEVQVGTRHAAGAPDRTDDGAHGYAVAHLDEVLQIVRIHRDEAVLVLDADHVAIGRLRPARDDGARGRDRKSTRLNSSHVRISYAVFCLKKKTKLKSSPDYRSYEDLCLTNKYTTMPS